MENSKLLNIIKELNNYRSKTSALYSLYNSSVLTAESNRAELSGFYEQLLDFKNDLNSLSSLIASVKKSERADAINQNKARIKRMVLEVKVANDGFNDNCDQYKNALKDCNILRKEYWQGVSDLCKEFKANLTKSVDEAIIKGYKQQVKVIKAIFEKIEVLISDYNIKRNKVEDDSVKFNQLHSSVNSLFSQLQTIA